LLAIGIVQQRDERRTVRVVLKALDGGFDVPLAALEVDDPIGALVTPAMTISGDAARIVAAARLGQAFGQLLDRLFLL